MGRDVYILQATSIRAPKICWSRPSSKARASLRYVASPLVTAMITGGIVILDEGNRMSEKSWASLAPLLDNRRYVGMHRRRRQDQSASEFPPRQPP